ncbi:hypothetical protein RCL_jg3348.t1 [Rhizophagus clarus]|uniref:Uncharacterized protein n=1 Tax=Rhizophagus clarus TaxID=94130 RepID=A0A8H3R571_9GLOM|nr:hypothetical protein RCL_jg3348.t1 [Rhizophagus clarus]
MLTLEKLDKSNLLDLLLSDFRKTRYIVRLLENWTNPNLCSELLKAWTNAHLLNYFKIEGCVVSVAPKKSTVAQLSYSAT